ILVLELGGDVNINNNGGKVFGAGEFCCNFFGTGNGIGVAFVGGNVNISNLGGLTFGYTQDGINIFDIFKTAKVTNGAGGGELGIILGAEEGIAIASVPHAKIDNFSGGAILGNGSFNNFSPVIFLSTFQSEGGGAEVYNAGLMSSYRLPYFHGPT